MSAEPPIPATRTEALARLKAFLPRAGRDYAARRNYDLGPGRHEGVSQLSPFLRHRLLTEAEVLEAVLAQHSLSAAQKFVAEVFWRTYWKGWLEMRPQVWQDYRRGLDAALNRVQTEGGLRRQWEAACAGDTGIDAFDHWARELTTTGYMHNHARMWFASIWIFTLRLPWELGADFFLRHLLDGDPASNTLSWRWVGGIQTTGKTYLARPSNIARYTEGRFHPAGQLAPEAPPLPPQPHPPRMALPDPASFDPGRPTLLLLTEEDLSPGFLFDRGLAPVASAGLLATAGRSPLAVAPTVTAFVRAAMEDTHGRYAARLGASGGIYESSDAAIAELAAFARSTGAEQIVTAYAPVGPAAIALERLGAALVPDIPVIRLLRDYDARAWPHATHGFFRFKENIPTLVAHLKGIAAA